MGEENDKHRKHTKPAKVSSKGDAKAVTTEKLFSALEDDLWSRMKIILKMLDLKHRDENLFCAGDLVAFAIGSGWLDEENFMC